MSFSKFIDKQPPTSRRPNDLFADADSVRLNRYISASGVCSRRKADEFISAGRVKVNGEVVDVLGSRVTASDVVEFNGRRISPTSLRYLVMNKPRDTITTVSDEKSRRTVLDLVDEASGLHPVGRLDRNTEGLLLITNDGELTHRLTHPKFGVAKIYEVTTRDFVSEQSLEDLRSGVVLDDGPASADQVSRVQDESRNVIAIAIHEGRNRQVRRMLEAIGHEVIALKRIRYGKLTLSGLRSGKWRALTASEVRSLKTSVGLKG